MSDLIKRSDVIKALEQCYLDKQLFEKDVFEKINAIPTAYDKDNVVEELGKWSSEVQVVSEVNGKIHRVKVVNAERAINIAREGGVE